MEHVSILCSRRARSLHTPNDASQRKLNDVSTAALMAAWLQFEQTRWSDLRQRHALGKAQP
jgi:hypothetical protein